MRFSSIAKASNLRLHFEQEQETAQIGQTSAETTSEADLTDKPRRLWGW
jgi:hypothetical protein